MAYATANAQVQEQRMQKQNSSTAAGDFYYKGWRGESDDAQRDEEDELQVVLKTTHNGKDLRKALQQLLESGGDERSLTDPQTGLTKYHTPSSPCEGIHRSCCTSNAPNEEAFNRGVDTLRQLLLEAKNMSKQKNHDMIYSSPEDLFRKLLCDIRERLRAVFGLSFEDTISLFPSGTDAELMPSLVAFLRAVRRRDRGSDIFSIITAAGEVGSGTLLASMGQHFAKRLPSGRVGCCSVGDRVFGLGDGAAPGAGAFTGATLTMRDEQGCLLSPETRDWRVEEMVREAATALDESGKPRYGAIVVHMVVGSKTGHVMPSADCLDRLVAQYGSLVVPVVDACQGRLCEEDIREFLDKGHIVLSTGSKFYGGPPFSGVCLMSEGTAQELEQMLSDSEAMEILKQSRLKEYVVASLMSDDLPKLRSLLPQRPLNYGALMRWTVALHNMEHFYSDVPAAERVGLMRDWSSGVRDLVRGSGGSLIQLQEDPPEGSSDEQEAALSTIVSFHCYCNRGTPETSADKMTMDELRHLQFLMASDLTVAQPHLNLLGLAKTRCFMGQPVDLVPEKSGAKSDRSMHVLRVAASAPVIVRAWYEGLDVVLQEDRAVFDKLRLVLGSWYLFQGATSNL